MTSSAQNSKQYLAQQGSATVPAYSFLGDQDTGIYRPGANELSVATGGVQRGYFSSTGAVYFFGDTTVGSNLTIGSGVSTGSATIEVGGDRTGSGPSVVDFHSVTGTDYETRIVRDTGANGGFFITNRGTGDFQITQFDSGAIVFSTGNTEKARITSAGYVGIGNSDPYYPLDITSGTATNSTGLRIRATSHATSRRAAVQLGDWSVLQDADANGTKDFGFYDANAAAFRFLINTVGNVAIGGTPNTYSGYRTLALNNTSGSVVDLHVGGTRGGTFYADGSGVTIGCVVNSPTIFLQNAGEKARIDTNGNFLFGLTYNASATGAKLYAYESNGNAAISAHNGAQNSFGLAVQLQYTNSYFAWFNFGSTTVGSIGTNGSSTSYNTSSDYRLKTNVLPLTGSLERILAIEPSTFDWLHNGDKGVGFIAHKLAEHIPYAVTGEKDAVDPKGNIRPQGVDQSKIVPDLVAAFQTLYAKLTAAEARISTLETT